MEDHIYNLNLFKKKKFGGFMEELRSWQINPSTKTSIKQDKLLQTTISGFGELNQG